MPSVITCVRRSACFRCVDFEPMLGDLPERWLEALLLQKEQLQRMANPMKFEVNDRMIRAMEQIIRLRSESGNPRTDT